MSDMARQNVSEAFGASDGIPGTSGAEVDWKGLSCIRALAALPKEERGSMLKRRAAVAAGYYASIVDEYDDYDEPVEY